MYNKHLLKQSFCWIYSFALCGKVRVNVSVYEHVVNSQFVVFTVLATCASAMCALHQIQLSLELAEFADRRNAVPFTNPYAFASLAMSNIALQTLVCVCVFCYFISLFILFKFRVNVYCVFCVCFFLKFSLWAVYFFVFLTNLVIATYIQTKYLHFICLSISLMDLVLSFIEISIESDLNECFFLCSY